MQAAVPVGEGMMIAVLGTKIETIKDLINLKKLIMVCVRLQTIMLMAKVIVSGDKKSILSFSETLKSQKIKSIPLKVSAPFHCSLMKNAAGKNVNKNLQYKIFKTII